MEDYLLKHSGEEIDDILDSVKDKVSKVEGKGLSTEDFTTLLKQKLESLQNYDDTAIRAAIAKLRSDFDTLVEGDTSGAIDKFNEIIAFLDGIEDSQSLDSIIASIEQQIAGKQSAITDLDTIRDGAAKGQTSAQSVYINGQLKTPDSKGIINLGNIDPAVDTYVADFNLFDVLAGTAVTIKEDFVEAIRNNKVIFIPFRTFVVIATAQLQADEDSMIYLSIHARINEQLIEVQFSCDTVPATVVGRIFTTTLATKDELDKKVGKGEAIDFATDLTGVIETTPEMFTYRPSAGDKSVRDESAVIRRIKGNSAIFSQSAGYVKNSTYKGITIVHNNNGVIELSGELTDGETVQSGYLSNVYGHKYLIVMEVLSMGDATSFLGGNLNIGTTSFNEAGKKWLIRTSSRNSYISYVGLYNLIGSYNGVKYRYQQFDLTELFDAGNEPTTYEEFRHYYPDDYYPNCEPVLRSMRATGIETIGFNAYNGEYAEVIGGQTYYLGVTIDTAHFATEIGGDSVEITIPENRLYTPPTNGYIYATGSDICINLSHSGVRNGEYKPYEKNTLLLPEIAKYFPNGMHGIGDVCDEINEEMAIQRCDVRAYEEGDENNAEVKTDKTTTVYKLSEPIYTPIDEPMQLDYKVDDFGTEKMLSDAPSSPFKADIVYQFNAEGRIRDNSRNIERLEEQLNRTKEEFDSKKQDTLSLTVKDNGNIVIGNINGQSKEFMPATPSGDPMHYAYEVAGAVWNNDTGFWEYRADEGGLTDLTNEDMKVCYAEAWLNTGVIGGGMFYNMSGRTIITNASWSSAVSWYNYGRGGNLEVGFVCARSGITRATPSSIATVFCNCPKLKRVIGKIDLLYCKSAFEISNSPLLEEITFSNLRSNVSIKHSSNISKVSILGAINDSYPDLDSSITITVEASAYARLSADADIIAALEAHPLVTLVSA